MEDNTAKMEALKADVMDLLNQIAIKLKDIGDPLMQEDDYTYHVITDGTTEGYDDETGKWVEKEVDGFDKNTQYLACVKAMVERAVKGDLSEVAYNENQYYTSNC